MAGKSKVAGGSLQLVIMGIVLLVASIPLAMLSVASGLERVLPVALLAVVAGLCYYSVKKYRMAKMMLDTKAIDKMSKGKFKQYMKYMYRKLGYKAKVVNVDGYRADVIADKGDERLIIHTATHGGKVEQQAVQEVAKAKETFNGTRAVIITSNGLSAEARLKARDLNVSVIERKQLDKMLLRVRKIDENSSDVGDSVKKLS